MIKIELQNEKPQYYNCKDKKEIKTLLYTLAKNNRRVTSIIYLIMLSAFFSCNNVSLMEPEPEKDYSENNNYITTEKTYNLPADKIHISANVFSYNIRVGIYDYKGGGYQDKRTYAHTGDGTLENCFERAPGTLTVNNECIDGFFTDYATALNFTIIIYSRG